MNTFEDNTKILDELGIQYHLAYEYRGEPGKDRAKFDLNLFDNILIPFTSEEWCRLCMREGDLYIGGCCGNTSNLQDYLNGWFRDGGWVSVKDIAEFAESIFDHEGFEEWDDKVSIKQLYKKVKDNWNETYPLDKLAFIWKLVKDHYSPERPSVVHETKRNDPYISMSNLAKSLQTASWHSMFKQDDKDTAQDKAWVYSILCKIIPALNELNNNITKLNVGPFEAVAIVDKDATEEITRNILGQCIYADESKVREIFNLWDKTDSEYKEKNIKPARERYKVRKVIVSIENGIEFGDFIEV